MCEYEGYMIWKHEGNKELPFNVLPSFNGSAHTLHIVKIQMNNAGKYTCHDSNHLDHYKSMYLIVSGMFSN